MVLQHRKIEEFKKRETPISYSNLTIAERKKNDFETLLDQRIISGYAIIWSNINGNQERFVKGSCAKSIADFGPSAENSYKIKFRDRHGKSCSLFAELKEDDIGLFFRTKPLDNVPWANDLLVQIRSGTINNFSIGFRHIWDKVEWDEQNDCLVCLEIKLYELSAVDIPSELGTYVVRTAEEIEYLQDDIEDFIESLPKSVKLQARHIITRCMSLRNDEPQDFKKRALENKPTEVEVDFNYLIKNLNITR